MPIVFGYGSLINRSSAEKTLGRSLCQNQICCATAHHFVRSWTARGCVRLQYKERVIPCDAVFLDLTERHGGQCNGVMIDVSQRELAQLDIREKGYERCAVDLETQDGLISGYTYVIPEEDKFGHGIILGNYKKIIEEALQELPDSFSTQFWESTLESDVPVMDGHYIFEDCAQNGAAGHCLEAPWVGAT